MESPWSEIPPGGSLVFGLKTSPTARVTNVEFPEVIPLSENCMIDNKSTRNIVIARPPVPVKDRPVAPEAPIIVAIANVAAQISASGITYDRIMVIQDNTDESIEPLKLDCTFDGTLIGEEGETMNSKLKSQSDDPKAWSNIWNFGPDDFWGNIPRRGQTQFGLLSTSDIKSDAHCRVNGRDTVLRISSITR